VGSPLRVLLVTQVYPPDLEASGQAVKVRAIAQRLAGRGHRTTVLTARHSRADAPAIMKGVEVVRLPSVFTYRALTVSPGVLAFCRSRLRQFDLVHIFGLYDLIGPPVARYCDAWNIPYVLEPIGMFRPIVRNVSGKRLYHRVLGRTLVRGAAHVIATSDLERDELIREGVPQAKIVVRANGVELAEFEHLPPRGAFRRSLGLAEDVPLILYLGRVSHKKGLDLLIRALRSVPPQTVLALVGADDRDGSAQEVLRLRAALRLESRVHVLPPRYDVEKLQALVDADIFVLPSRSENFGNAAAEAIASGLPVIVTDRCGVAAFVQDRAGLVVPCDVAALARAVTSLVENRALREWTRASALAARRDLDWDRPIAQLERLYDHVAARARQPARLALS
jgi:glycosyltransferase involved in cell wall biosynthesis